MDHPSIKYLDQVEAYLVDLRRWNPPATPTGQLDLQIENIRDARHLIKRPCDEAYRFSDLANQA